MPLIDIARLHSRQTGRSSSWDRSGRNRDCIMIPAGTTHVLADLKGPGMITHLWMTQSRDYRECLLKITWDNAPFPSVLCPLGDFFGLGHGIVNSYQSLLFTASTNTNNRFNEGCALNSYVPMPFRKRAVVELVNECPTTHLQYFYVDYERVAPAELRGLGYFHAEFRRACPFGGWGPHMTVNTPPVDVANMGRLAWRNNYVILDTRGRGHYLGCNLSVTNIQGTWWGEGDDMIWVDGYKWPPDLHGTGSEDYLNQAWGMQANAFLRNGSSIHESQTGGYQTSYVHHLENPVHFKRELKVTIEHGHGNHLGNEMSSVAYWYAEKPTRIAAPPPMQQRLPVLKKDGQWVIPPERRCPGKPVVLSPEIKSKLKEWRAWEFTVKTGRLSTWHSTFVDRWQITPLQPARDLKRVPPVRLRARLNWQVIEAARMVPHLINVNALHKTADGLVYLGNRFKVARAGRWTLQLGHDAGAKLFVDGKAVLCEPRRVNPAPYERSQATVALSRGIHEIMVAFDTDHGMGWGIFFSFEIPQTDRHPGVKPVFPTALN